MTNPTDISQNNIFQKTVRVHAPASAVWEALIQPELMQKWMSETNIEVITDWQVGHPFLVRGILHRVKFENKGTVLQFEPERMLSYSHLSSISRLPDVPESYTILAFALRAVDAQTELTFTANNFPTETIYKHFRFYWNVTLEILRKMIEKEE